MNAKIHLHEMVNDKKAAHNANGFEVENNNTKMLKMLWAMLKNGRVLVDRPSEIDDAMRAPGQKLLKTILCDAT